MDTDINDIWDLPVETSAPLIPLDNPDGEGPTSSSRASSAPLFLPSDDEEDTAAANANAQRNANQNADIDALFEGLDDMDDGFQELAPSLDLDALRREADARNARIVRAEMSAGIPAAEPASTAAGKTNGGRGWGALDAIDGDGEDDGKKKRKPVFKLDEARLLSKDGFPQLVKDTKNFKPKGKGHEKVDLDRVLQVYQFWTHKLYPKTRFKETVDRVEKLCHSKRMQVALSVWRDEALGLVNGVRLPSAGDNNDSDEDSDADGGVPRARDNEAVTAAAEEDGTSSSRAPSPARSSLRQGGGVPATTDSDRDGDDPHLSSDAPHPPSSPDRDEATIELDALLEAEEASRASTHNAPTGGHAWKTSNDDAVAMDEDEDLWDSLNTGAPASAPVPVPVPAPRAMDDDEEMWDIVHELEQEKAKETARTDPVQAPPAARDDQADDLEDMYS